MVLRLSPLIVSRPTTSEVDTRVPSERAKSGRRSGSYRASIRFRTPCRAEAGSSPIRFAFRRMRTTTRHCSRYAGCRPRADRGSAVDLIAHVSGDVFALGPCAGHRADEIDSTIPLPTLILIGEPVVAAFEIARDLLVSPVHPGFETERPIVVAIAVLARFAVNPQAGAVSPWSASLSTKFAWMRVLPSCQAPAANSDCADRDGVVAGTVGPVPTFLASAN